MYWEPRPFVGAPELWTVGAGPVDPDETDECLLAGNDFLTPATLFITHVDQEPEVLRTSPARFDPSGLKIEQHFATSLRRHAHPLFPRRP